MDNTRNPQPSADVRKSPYTAYLRNDTQAQRRPHVNQVVRQDAISSHDDVARYTVNANTAPSKYRENRQDAQLHDGMMDMRLHSREDSGIDDHDESVHDRYNLVVCS